MVAYAWVVFQDEVLAVLAGDIPVLGVLREGNIPWHSRIVSNPKVDVWSITEENRNLIPERLAIRLCRPTML
jgi:nucleoside-triphosphatase THEP1